MEIRSDKKPDRDLVAMEEIIMEKIRSFRLFDDSFMSVIFRDIGSAEFLIRIVLEDEKLRVVRVETQKELNNLYGHSARLDILAETGDGRMINVEVQRKKEGFTPKRARYYGSLMDANILPKGDKYDRLPDRCIIVMCEEDPFGKGHPLYHARMVIKETDENLEDGASTVFVNCEVIDDTALGKLAHDFFCSDPDEMFYDILRDRVSYFKKDHKGVMEMRDITAELIEEGRGIGREEGFERGREKNMYETAERMIKENFSYSTIARISQLDEREVEKLAIEIREREAKYSASENN